MSSVVLLLIQSTCAGAVLLWALRKLQKRGLFRWTAAGFWAWATFGLFLFLVPFYAIFDRGTTFYYTYVNTLAVSGGAARALLIAGVSAAGMLAFFWAYLRAPAPALTWRFGQDRGEFRITKTMWAVMWFCILAGSYELIRYRSGLAGASNDTVVGGRLVGGVTGYQADAHMLLFVPVVLLLLSRVRRHQAFGLFLALGYVAVKSLDPWGRYLAVSMIIVVSLVFVLKQGRHWPPLPVVLIAAFLALLLAVRGHATFTSTSDFAQLATEAPAQIGASLGSQGNLGMLNTFYLQSYVSDSVVGYNYGIPLVNYGLTGWLPNSYFPWKYFLVDWLHARQYPHLDPYYIFRLSIQKSTLLGSFYAEGGFLGMLLLAALAGMLARKLDGMVREDATMLVRATGLAWMAVLWMTFASDDWWGLTTLGTLFLPTLAMWVLSAMLGQRAAPLRHSTRPAIPSSGAGGVGPHPILGDGPVRAASLQTGRGRERSRASITWEQR